MSWSLRTAKPASHDIATQRRWSEGILCLEWDGIMPASIVVNRKQVALNVKFEQLPAFAN